jgi:hypothetical protein
MGTTETSTNATDTFRHLGMGGLIGKDSRSAIRLACDDASVAAMLVMRAGVEYARGWTTVHGTGE